MWIAINSYKKVEAFINFNVSENIPSYSTVAMQYCKFWRVEIVFG